MIRERVEANLSIGKTTIFSSFSVPNYYAGLVILRDTRVWISQEGHGRRDEARVMLSSQDPLFPPRRNLAPSPMRRSEKSSLHYQIRTTEESMRPKIMNTGVSGVLPYKKVAAREANSLPRIAPGSARESRRGEILSSPLDRMMPTMSSGYPRTLREREFSPLVIKQSFHREEIGLLEGETELLTMSLELREYMEKIRSLINAKKEYPQVARQRRWEGKIKVRFTISSSGTVIKTEVSSPCRYQALNQAAENLIGETSPFPPPPFSSDDDPLILEVLVVYELKESTLIKENER